MSKGQPFNLLKNVSELPVVVSKVRKAVWVGKRDPDHPGRKGLGRLCHSEGEWWTTDEWWGPDGEAPTQEDLRADWVYDQDNHLVKKCFINFKCDRLMLAQNCVVEKGEGEHAGQYRVFATAGTQWYAPQKNQGRAPTDWESLVRPWCGPGGDIEGWKPGKWADFRPFAVRLDDGKTKHSRQQAAEDLIEDGEIPEIWGIGERPFYKVKFKQPFHYERTEDGKVRVWEEDDPGDAEEYVATHAPDAVIFWRETSVDGNLRDKESYFFGWCAEDDAVDDSLLCPALWLQMLGRTGIAFDLMLFVRTYTIRGKERKYVAEKGKVTWTNSGWIMGGYEKFWAAVRVVKPLPPAEVAGTQEGGS